MHSLDAAKQKQLQGELSGGSSSTSLETAGSSSRPRTAGAAPGSSSGVPRARSMSTDRTGHAQGYM